MEAFPGSSPDLVWYTAGANDLAQDQQYHTCLQNSKNDKDVEACLDQANAIMMACTETLFKYLWDTFPEAKVGQYNYDVGCTENTQYGECVGASEEFMGGAYCSNSEDPTSCVGRAL